MEVELPLGSSTSKWLLVSNRHHYTTKKRLSISLSESLLEIPGVKSRNITISKFILDAYDHASAVYCDIENTIP